MGRAKIAITIEDVTIEWIDRLIKQKIYPNRSRAIEVAIKDMLERLGKNWLALECAKLDPAFEKALAEEGISEEMASWPEYRGER